MRFVAEDMGVAWVEAKNEAVESDICMEPDSEVYCGVRALDVAR